MQHYPLFRLPLFSLCFLLGLSACTLPVDEELPVPGVQVEHWCDAGLGGEPGATNFEHDFAAAHTLHRLFSTAPNWIDIDRELAGLLGGAAPFELSLLDDYSALFEAVCAGTAPGTGSLETRVTVSDGVAVVVPGEDEFELPESVVAVVIDLREVSPSADVVGAVGQALAEDVAIGTRRVQKFTGLPTHDDGWTHYDSGLAEMTLEISASGEVDLPLAFITGSRLSPRDATLVAGLRLAQRASIIGHDVFAAVAESSWSGVDVGGLFVRTSTLETEQGAWPDVIPADISTETPSFYLGEVATMELSEVDGLVERPEIVAFDRTGWDWAGWEV